VQVLVVLVGDGPAFERVQRALDAAGCRPDRAASLGEAELRVGGGADALLLDGRLIDSDVCARLRRRAPAAAIVAWLAVSSGTRTVELLGLAVDEVVSAAMGDAEIGARVVAAIRRERRTGGHVVEIGRLRVDVTGGEANWDGIELPLTPRERELLAVLAEARGQALRREVVYRRVWGYAMARGDRTVDVNVKRLRAKLARAAGDEIGVRTQPGFGYRLQVTPTSDAVTNV
jgi:DNA-binding response OmpR family regulator